MSTDTDRKIGYDLIRNIIFYFHISLKIALQQPFAIRVCRSATTSRPLQPASVNRQFGGSGSQTLTLGLQLGSFGALCWRRPQFHPGVFSQHVAEPERVSQMVKASSIYLLFISIFHLEHQPSLCSGPTCWCCCPGSTGPPWAP